jgi:Holliday junction resolvase RusA-like endonuclease
MIYSELKGTGDNYIVLDVEPCSAVRMTQSDRWKTNPNHLDPRKRQRSAVTKYFQYKNKVVQLCNEVNYTLSDALEIIFVLPIPDSWSNKKKKEYVDKPHQSRPDIDNLLKAFMDALSTEDGYVYLVKAKKIYGEKGKIILIK